jgi:hypothetical protein
MSWLFDISDCDPESHFEFINKSYGIITSNPIGFIRETGLTTEAKISIISEISFHLIMEEEYEKVNSLGNIIESLSIKSMIEMNY